MYVLLGIALTAADCMLCSAWLAGVIEAAEIRSAYLELIGIRTRLDAGLLVCMVC